MNSFAIDIYIWDTAFNGWLLVPARYTQMRWPAFPGVSQAALLSSAVGITFRIDDVLWLGNERDAFPIEMVAYDLFNTIGGGTPGNLLAKMATNESLAVEIRQSIDGRHVLLSRTSNRSTTTDYLEQTARNVGTYYHDIPIESQLWKKGVAAALGGLADALRACPPPSPSEEHESLARWLLSTYESI
jgi:hypothetical protein